MKFISLFFLSVALVFQIVSGSEELVPATLEWDLTQTLGWSKQEIKTMARLLTTIDRISTVVTGEPQMDPATVALVAEFQSDAHALIATPALLRASATGPTGFAGLVEKLLMGLIDLVDKLKKATEGNDFFTKVLGKAGIRLKVLLSNLEIEAKKHKKAHRHLIGH